jgi:hypothetical protein
VRATITGGGCRSVLSLGILNMRRCYKLAIGAAAAAVGFACYWYGGTPRTGGVPRLPETPLAIDISVGNRLLATAANRPGLEWVMEMLRSGRSIEAHKCKSRGVMVLHFSGEKSLRVDLVPGHHFLRYEFITSDGTFAVSRSRFMKALKDVGVDVEEIPTG